jgi:hypothetical protein
MTSSEKSPPGAAPKQLSRRLALYKTQRKVEKAKAQVRTKLDHISGQTNGSSTTSECASWGLQKTAQLVTLLAVDGAPALADEYR